MANDLTSNPMVIDTAATIITTFTNVLAMQWIDDDNAAGGAIGDGEGLAMVMNKVELQFIVNDISALGGGMAWSISFCRPFGIEKLVVGTIDGGSLLIWKA